MSTEIDPDDIKIPFLAKNKSKYQINKFCGGCGAEVLIGLGHPGHSILDCLKHLQLLNQALEYDLKELDRRLSKIEDK